MKRPLSFLISLISLIISIFLTIFIAGCYKKIYIESDSSQSHLSVESSKINTTVNKTKPQPSVKFTIHEDFSSMGKDKELIYEDGNYQYYLTTTRSDDIMIEFENGDKISMKTALESKKITIDDLIAAGQQMIMRPRENPLGGEFFVPQNHYKFTVRDCFPFYPSSIFMYNLYDDSFSTFFHLDELADILSETGMIPKGTVVDMLNKKTVIIAGKRYVKQNDLLLIGFSVKIGWEVSSLTPIEFVFNLVEASK